MKKTFAALSALLLPLASFASEADLKMPEGFSEKASILYWGFLVIVLAIRFLAIYESSQASSPQLDA